MVDFAREHSIFVDRSVDTGDISDDLSDESIRRTIRDKYLRDSTVTIVLVGSETRRRKHVDWEIHSSMYDGTVNSRSGILVINLPETCKVGPIDCIAAHKGEKATVYPKITSWTSITSWAECERLFPYMPERIIDNLVKAEVPISVVPWNRIDTRTLAFLVEAAYEDRALCKYDLRRPMRRANS